MPLSLSSVFGRAKSDSSEKDNTESNKDKIKVEIKTEFAPPDESEEVKNEKRFETSNLNADTSVFEGKNKRIKVEIKSESESGSDSEYSDEQPNRNRFETFDVKPEPSSSESYSDSLKVEIKIEMDSPIVTEETSRYNVKPKDPRCAGRSIPANSRNKKRKSSDEDYTEEDVSHDANKKGKGGRQRVTVSEFQCKLCNRYFSKKSSLPRHYKQMHFDYKNMKCRQCHTEFDRIETMESHRCGIKVSRRFKKKVEHKCEICNKLFSSGYTLSKHRNSNNLCLKKCNMCNERFKVPKDVLEHKCIYGKELKCPICEKLHESHMQLTLHLCRHFVGLTCRHCDVTIDNVGQMREHICTANDRKIDEGTDVEIFDESDSEMDSDED